MNLENLNVVELNAQEVQETEGGLAFLGACCIALAVVYVASTVYQLATSGTDGMEGTPNSGPNHP